MSWSRGALHSLPLPAVVGTSPTGKTLLILAARASQRTPMNYSVLTWAPANRSSLQSCLGRRDIPRHMGHVHLMEVFKTALTPSWLLCLSERAASIPPSRIVEILRRGSIPANSQVKLLLHWAPEADSTHAGPEFQLLADHINEIIPFCTQERLSEMVDTCSSRFDALVRSSVLWSQHLKGRKAFYKMCSTCGVAFANSNELKQTPCFKHVTEHSENTFISNKKNACCTRCSMPLDTSDPKCTRRVEIPSHKLLNVVEQ